jgi:hypothetical protein
MELAVVAGLGLVGSYIANNTKDENTDPILEPGYFSNSRKKNSNISENNMNKINKTLYQIESNENKADLTYDNGYYDSNNVKLFPSDINSKVHHLYDTRMVPKLKDKFYDMASEQREKSKIPERTNIIPPFFNQPYQNHLMSQSDALTMGPVPSSELLNSNNESFTSQFNLQTVDNVGEPASMGDTWNSTHRSNILNLERSLALTQGFSPFDTESTDMTYNIVPPEHFTHNNMQQFSSRRDNTNTESNSFEYKMEVFSGSSKNWNPKRETLPFFDPEEYKQTPFKQDVVVDQERDRIYQARVRQNERPFEPVRVAPGLNLDYDEIPVTGRHDTFRVMPKDTNDIRPANKPKLTYEGRVQGAPKKGEKRGVMGPVIKRRPEQWRYQTVDDLVANKAQVTGPTSQGNYLIPDNARMNTTCELKGPAQAPTQVGPENRAGDVKISKRVKHVEDKLGPKATDRFNLNDKSYNIALTERNTANYNDHMPAHNPNQGGQYYDPNNLAKTTKKQDIESFEPVGPNSTNAVQAYNPNDLANPTKKEQLTNKQLNTHAKANNGQTHTYNPNDLANSTKKEQLTNKQLNTHAKANNGQTHTYNPNDLANSTKKQTLTNKQLNTHAKANNGQVHTYDPNDLANPTKKQQLTNKQLNTHAKANNGQVHTYDPNDLANPTKKQTLTNKQLNTHAKANNGQTHAYDQNDITRTTGRQNLTDKQFNTHAGPNNGQTHAYDQNDITRTTGRQNLTEKQFNTHADPNNGQVHAYDQNDITRTTGRQTLTTKQFNTMIQQLVGSYSNLTDQARMTIKQILATQTYEQIMSSAQHNAYANLSDQARTTLRQVLSLAQFNTNAGPANKQVYANLTDQANTTLRQILSVLETNTHMGAANKQVYSNFTDDAKTTQRQTLSESEFNTVIGQLISSYANLTDQTRTTIKQLLSEAQFNTNAGPANKQVYSNLTDEARTTLKQILSMEEFNTALGPANKQVYANLSDQARTTLREILSALETNTHMGAGNKQVYSNLSDNARTTLKQILSKLQFNNNMGTANKQSYAELTDLAKHTIRELLTTMELNTALGPANKQVYANLSDVARTTTRETLTEAEFNTFLAKSIGSYSNLSDEVKSTLRQILATQELNTMMGTAQKGSYSNLSDEAKATLRQLLTLQTFSTHIRQNIGSYANLSDQAKTTLKQLLTLVETNNNIKSTQQGTYANLMDLAKQTIKEFIAVQEVNSNVGAAQKNPNAYYTDLAKSTHAQEVMTQSYNNNIGTVKREIAFDPNDLARHTHKQDTAVQQFNQHAGTTQTNREIAYDPNDIAKITHKQDLIHANYSGPMNNSSSGTQQVSFDIAPTMKDLNKAIDYKSAAAPSGFAPKPESQKAARNMRQNVTKEEVAQGRYPTLSGPKLIPTRDNYDSMEQKTKPNFNVLNPPALISKANLEDRAIFNVQHIKNKAACDERLYKELLSQFEDNPLINNPTKTVGAQFMSQSN